MKFRYTTVAFAALIAFGSAHAVTNGDSDVEYGTSRYQNEIVPEVRYESLSNVSNSRAAAVTSATTIQGCNAGLITVSGIYTCRSNALVSQGGTIPDPPPVYSGGGSGSSYRGGGDDGWGSSPPSEDRNFVGYAINGPAFGGTADDVSSGRGGGGGGGGGSSRVICTHFFAKGEIPRDVWRADLAYTKANLSETTVRGYHAWAIGYVKLMRKSKLAEDIMRPIALHRAQELAYQMGVVEKGSWRGKLARLALEPLCFAIGTCVGARDYMALWKDQPHVLKLVDAQA